jgi:hypothetical protein
MGSAFPRLTPIDRCQSLAQSRHRHKLRRLRRSIPRHRAIPRIVAIDRIIGLTTKRIQRPRLVSGSDAAAAGTTDRSSCCDERCAADRAQDPRMPPSSAKASVSPPAALPRAYARVRQSPAHASRQWSPLCGAHRPGAASVDRRLWQWTAPPAARRRDGCLPQRCRGPRHLRCGCGVGSTPTGAASAQPKIPSHTGSTKLVAEGVRRNEAAGHHLGPKPRQHRLL